MTQLKDIDRALAEILLDNVINKRGNPTYKEIADELAKRLGREINPHYHLSNPLGIVSTLCFELGLPLISARVIYSGATTSQVVGEGFYSFACDFRPEYRSMTPVDVWKHELSLIRECKNWGRLRDYLDGVPIDIILSRESISETAAATPQSRAASRGVRNFGTPGGKLGCVSQQRLNGFRIQVCSGNSPVLGILYEVGCH